MVRIEQKVATKKCHLGVSVWVVAGYRCACSILSRMLSSRALCDHRKEFPNNLLGRNTLPAFKSVFPFGAISTDLPADHNCYKGEENALQGGQSFLPQRVLENQVNILNYHRMQIGSQNTPKAENVWTSIPLEVCYSMCFYRSKWLIAHSVPVTLFLWNSTFPQIEKLDSLIGS